MNFSELFRPGLKDIKYFNGNFPDLRIERLGPPRGFLWWKFTEYGLYQPLPDGTKHEILTGAYRDSNQLKQTYVQKLRSEGKLP